MKRFIANEDTDLRTFTDNTCAQASFCLRRLFKDREIRVNGAKVGENIPLHAGDEVCYFMSPAEESRKAFSTVCEDDFMEVIDKESGVNCEAVFCETGYYAVHRLDRNTAGLMILAKTKEAEEELLGAFRERRVEKIYHALVVGRMQKRKAVERAFLLKDERTATVRITARGPGVPICTEYEVLEERGECSLLKITLHTGRTHQIRAHMAFLGHPVVGDGKYGDGTFNRKLHLTRQQLIAKELILHTRGVLAYAEGAHFVSEREL